MSILQRLFDIAKQLFDSVLEWVVTFFGTIYNWLMDSLETIYEEGWNVLLDNFPQVAQGLETLQPYYQFMDYFIDMNLCLAGVSAYLSYWGFWFTYKHVLVWIPTIGGSP